MPLRRALTAVVFAASALSQPHPNPCPDPAKAWDTVNGIAARGGVLDGGGPTVASGMLYVNSGYGRMPGQPGNVLLAFSVDGK